MRKFLLGFSILAMLLWTLPVAAQVAGYPQIQIAPTPAVAVQAFVPGTIADEAVVNKQLTVTITPPSGQYFYLTNLEYATCSNGTATPAVINQTFTQTGFTALPINNVSQPTSTLNTCAQVVSKTYAWPVKSATAGGVVTFVSPAANTNTAFTLHAFGFFAP